MPQTAPASPLLPAARSGFPDQRHTPFSLWQRRKGRPTALAVSLPKHAKASAGEVRPNYAPTMFSVRPPGVTACVELCVSTHFPPSFFRTLEDDLHAEGVTRLTLRTTLHDAREELGQSVDERGDGPLLILTSSGETHEQVANLTSATRYSRHSYRMVHTAYVRRGPLPGSGALLLRLRACARPMGDRRNAVVCIAVHQTHADACCLAARALGLYNAEERRRRGGEGGDDEDAQPTPVAAARFFFTHVPANAGAVHSLFVANPGIDLVCQAQLALYFAGAHHADRVELPLPPAASLKRQRPPQ